MKVPSEVLTLSVPLSSLHPLRLQDHDGGISPSEGHVEVFVLMGLRGPPLPFSLRDTWLPAALRWVLASETFLIGKQQFALMEEQRTETPKMELTMIYFISGWPFRGS